MFVDSHCFNNKGGISMCNADKVLDRITKKLIKERVKLLKSCGFTKEEINNRISVEDVRSFIADGIAEWEKQKQKYNR